jgi:small subunit ribosomal protein S1
MEFSNDHTVISDVYKVGDTVKVKLHKVTSTKRILVEAVEKYCNPTAVDFDTFAPNQVVYGRIRTIRTWGCYVCIAPGLDALAPIPGEFDIQEGDTVLLKTTKVDPEQRRVRGKVLKVINENEDFELDN